MAFFISLNYYICLKMFREVWNIESRQALDSNFLSASLTVGVSFIVVGLLMLISKKMWGVDSRMFRILNYFSTPKYPYNSVLFILIGFIPLTIAFFSYTRSKTEIVKVEKQMKNGGSKIVEGIVQVEFVQPEEGHTKGDIVHINNKTFQISNFHGGPFYHQSIKHEGVVKEGAHLRIHYFPTKPDEKRWFGDGKIVKIELD